MALSLDDTINAIGRIDARWKAENTPFSGLDFGSGGARMFGLKRPPSDDKPMAGPRLKAAGATRRVPPKSVDWRNTSMGSLVTPVRDQGSTNSCVAFATLAALESAVLKNKEVAMPAIDFSEADLLCEYPDVYDEGWFPIDALNHLVREGVADETAMPFTGAHSVCLPNLAKTKISSHRSVSVHDIDQRKAAVAFEGPAVAGMMVFEDFVRYYRSGVYRYAAGELMGLHAVCVVGYSDNDRCWIVKNSWGTGFGENGFFRIGYGECGIDTEFDFHSIFV